jgi:hypothetical protein
MKKIKYLGYTLALAMAFAACEQETITLTEPEPNLTNVGEDACPEGASKGSADFTKFVAIGTSYTAGFQAGALFNEGQNNSLAAILANQFECVSGGVFNQPSIRSESGYNIFVTPNPVGSTVFGRFKLQGTPPKPTPVVSGVDAIPNPTLNPAFMYTGSGGAVATNQLNNFSVPAIQLGQAFIEETGAWSGAGADPRFSPFYARFASDGGAGSATLFGDAISSLSNGGTFFLFWMGMDDILLHAAFGGDPAKAPLTPVDFVSASNPGFKILYNNAVNGLLANPTVEGVVANYPDLFTLPHFTLVPYNPLPLDGTTATLINNNYAGYNQILNALKGPPFNYSAADMDARKITFQAGNNAFVIIDETLNDLGDEFDALQGGGAITADQRAALVPYEQVRQTKPTDVIPLSTASVLGTLAVPGNPLSVRGVAVPLADQYAIIPSEKTEINDRLAAFNEHIKSVADANARLAFADVNKALKDLITTKAAIINGVTITPNINPPTGIYSEDGIHPNSRGYAFLANVFIDAINAKFGATIPKANLSKYSATGLPINP